MNDPLVERIVSRIAEAIHPTKIILFGSRARENAHPDSDVDLLIVYDGNLSKREISSTIRNLFTPQDFSMDLFVLTSDEFERQKKVISTVGHCVANEGIICYG